MCQKATIITLLLFGLVSAPGFSQEATLSFENGDISESGIPGVTLTPTQVSGDPLNYPYGIGIIASSYLTHSGTYAALLVSNWQEDNGEVVYKITSHTTYLSFYYLLGVGSTDGHQGDFSFSIDGEVCLSGRIPSITVGSGGTDWMFYNISGLTDEFHLFEWRLVDKDRYTGSWFFLDDVTLGWVLPLMTL